MMDPFSSSPTTTSGTSPQNTNTNSNNNSPSQHSRYNSSNPNQNNNNNNNNQQQMGSPQNSNFSVDSQGNVTSVNLTHGLKKWTKQEGINNPPLRPSAPFALVTFCARINAAVYEPNSANSQNSNGEGNTRMVSLVDQFDQAKPLDAILGVTRLFKGLEIGLRSMSLNEQSDFYVPPEMAHYYGGAQLPPRSTLEMDLKLLSVDNATKIQKLPMIDYEPFKIVRQMGNVVDPTKRVNLGSTVDFLLQRPHERTGAMGPSRKMQVVIGTAQFDPLLDMILMSMTEREISMFILRPNSFEYQQHLPPEQFYITVIKVTPSSVLPLPINATMMMKVYDPSGANSNRDHHIDEDNNSSSSPVSDGMGSQRASSANNNNETSLQHSASAVLDLNAFNPQIVEQSLVILNETAKKAFDAEQFVVASWYFSAAAAITRQKTGMGMDAMNKALARLSRNMGRCAFKMRRFSDALQLARESYSFDSTDAKGAFLLAQSLRENDLLNEAKVILGECAKMPDCHSESFDTEIALLDSKITSKSAPPSPEKQL